MLNLAYIEDENLNQTFRLMKSEIINRNWKATIPYIGSAHCFIDRGDGAPIHVFSTTPPTTSYAAASIANDKFGSYQVFKTIGLPQPDSIIVSNSSDPEEARRFLLEHGTIVVKPTDGGHGKGITVGVKTIDGLYDAVTKARMAKKSIDAAIVQKQYIHDVIYDIRLATIDYKFVAATWRLPARVFGDGEKTIEQLIVAENKSEKRGRPYYAKLAEIDIDAVRLYLGERINSVPAANEEVFVLGVANYGAGGETIDITDDLPDWLIEYAEQASQAIELPVAGVDFMLASQPSAQSTHADLDPMLIEINKCPSFAIHDLPTTGTPRNTVGIYLDYLSKI